MLYHKEKLKHHRDNHSHDKYRHRTNLLWWTCGLTIGLTVNSYHLLIIIIQQDKVIQILIQIIQILVQTELFQVVFVVCDMILLWMVGMPIKLLKLIQILITLILKHDLRYDKHDNVRDHDGDDCEPVHLPTNDRHCRDEFDRRLHLRAHWLQLVHAAFVMKNSIVTTR